MKAVLLAAGLATRLRPRTDSVPKCMVPVGGKPVLQHGIEWLRDNGVVELAVNLHHRPEVLRSFLGSGETFGVSVHYSYEADLLGTAGAVLRLADWLDDEDFLVLYADNIIACNLAALLRTHDRLAASLTMALYWRRDVSASGVAESDGEGRITAFIEKPPPGKTASNWVGAGLLACRRDVMSFIPRDHPSDFGADVFPALLAAGHIVGGYRMSGSEALYWIDTPKDLDDARAALALTRRSS